MFSVGSSAGQILFSAANRQIYFLILTINIYTLKKFIGMPERTGGWCDVAADFPRFPEERIKTGKLFSWR